MDIVRVFNGLGNQMSQYAFYLAKKKRHPFMTFWTYLPEKNTSTDQHNGYELDKVFGIRRNRLKDWILAYIYYSPKMADTVEGVWEVQNYDFIPEMLEVRTPRHFRYFFGGWHSEKYFRDIEKKIRKTFKFNENKLNNESKKWLEQILGGNSCSVHIRRGDYLENSVWNGVANLDYYRKAIALIKEKFPDIQFFIFSNDEPWARHNFSDYGCSFINCNKGSDSWQDMFLMSRCRHHINANSTFSWWAAWLCPYNDTTVVTPSRFMSDTITKDIYPQKWIKID